MSSQTKPPPLALSPSSRGTPPAFRAGESGSVTVVTGPDAGVTTLLDRSELVIGRDTQAHLALSDPGLSRRHAKIFRKGPHTFVEDLGSKNGTFLRGTRISRPEILASGDRVQLGPSTLLRFSSVDETAHSEAREMYKKMVRDSESQTYSRRFLLERAGAELAIAAQTDARVTAFLIEIEEAELALHDHGKRAASKIVRMVAAAIAQVMRSEDVVGKLSSTRVGALARGLSDAEAQFLALRLRERVESLTFDVDEGLDQSFVTLRVGIATRTAKMPFTDPQSFFRAAERNLAAIQD